MKKHYYYDVSGRLQSELLSTTKLVSENPLPAFSKKYSGCSGRCNNIPTNTPLKTKITVAFGDPRIFDCEVISFSELVDAPEKVKRHILDDNRDRIGESEITLKYKGGKIWTSHRHLCLEKDLK